MKKKLLIALSLVLLSSTFSFAYSKTNVNSDLANAIKLYKSGNYSECYIKLEDAIKKDPSNGLAYYYKAMTAAQIGRKSEAIENYDKALSLSSPNSKLTDYATKGKRCLETPDKCFEPKFDSVMDEFVRSKNAAGITDEVRNKYELLKIKNIQNNMNKNNEINPEEFRGYRDFSSMNIEEGAPSNNEIIAAIRTLQKAGLYNNSYSELSMLMNNNSNDMDLVNFIGNSGMNHQLIQAMLTNNNLSIGF